MPSRDYTAEVEHHRRTEMEDASERLLAALCREHPRIIDHLQRKQQKRSN